MITIATHLSERSAKADTYRLRLLKELAIHYPEAHIIFILDSDRILLPSLPANCTVNLTGPRIRNRLLGKYYYEFKIPAILQRYNVSVFIPDGNMLARSSNRQYMVDEGNNRIKEVPKNLSGIITFNDKRKEFLSGLHKKVITVLPGAESSLNPSGYDEKIKVMDELTAGDEFFLTYFDQDSFEYFMPVMKAYSNFRKWQKSAMKLVLIFDPSVKQSIENKLSNYKYRDDVIIKPAEEMNNILPAAYAFIDTSVKELYMSLNAFACNVPVISFQQAFGDAVLKAEPGETSISEKMMVLYKEEITRLHQVENGRQVLAQYNWKTNIGRLMTWLEE